MLFRSTVDELSHNLLSSFGGGVVSGISTIGGIVGKAAITLILSLFFLLDGPELFNRLKSVREKEEGYSVKGKSMQETMAEQ